MRIAVIGVGRIGTLHAETIAALPDVDELIVCDAERGRAVEVADRIRAAGSVPEVTTAPTERDAIAAGIDGCVIATPTGSHSELILLAVAGGVPTFCEKPIAPDLAAATAVAARVRDSGVPIQVGFQRRFDRGFIAARDAVASARLGWVHTVRACTLDISPPPAGALLTSGGIFHDCSIHDIDALRYVLGQEVVEVYAGGSVRSGEPCFKESDDVDTAAALLTLEDGALALLSAARYNAAGYDVRLEVHGSRASVAVGFDDRLPLDSLELNVSWPAGPASAGFLERFHAAYVAEMAAFIEVVAGKRPSPCTVDDGLAATLIAEACDRSRREHRPVPVAEIEAELAATAVAYGGA